MTLAPEQPIAADPAEDVVRPGRPRDEAREQAILDAALELVAEVGLDKMSMDAVAARAKASKATIYRRWPGKQELVIEALQRRIEPALGPFDTGSLRGDLLLASQALCDQVSGADGGLICGIAAAARNEPALAQALQAHHDAKTEAATAILDRAKARGEVPPGVDPELLFEVCPAVALNRQMAGLPLDETFVTHLVDHILLPVLTARPSPA